MSSLESITNCITGRFKRFDNTSLANFKTANKDATRILTGSYGEVNDFNDWFTHLNDYVGRSNNQDIHEQKEKAFRLLSNTTSRSTGSSFIENVVDLVTPSKTKSIQTRKETIRTVTDKPGTSTSTKQDVTEQSQIQLEWEIIKILRALERRRLRRIN